MQEEVDEDAEEGAATKSAEGGFVKGGVTYRVGDCFYVPPDTFEQIEDPDAVKPEVPAYVAKSRFHKGGANAGLRAFGVAKLLGLKKTQGLVSQPVGVLQCHVSTLHCVARLGERSSLQCLPAWRRAACIVECMLVCIHQEGSQTLCPEQDTSACELPPRHVLSLSD